MGRSAPSLDAGVALLESRTVQLPSVVLRSGHSAAQKDMLSLFRDNGSRKSAILPRRSLQVLSLCLFGALLFYLFTGISILPSGRSGRPTYPIPGDGTETQRTAVCDDLWPGGRKIPASLAPDPSGLPAARLGLVEVLGGHADRGCTPARERLGAFGHSSVGAVDSGRQWDSVRWGSVQSQCAARHFPNRHAPLTIPLRRLARSYAALADDLESPVMDQVRTGRTAVVLRVWDEYKYSANQLAWLRAMITELALDTGGTFQVFMLVNVKNETLDLFDDRTYAEVLDRSVPEEFRDLALLYGEQLLREWYPEVDEHGAQDQMYQALQIFSYSFPEFDFIWQLEMDVRFTDNTARMLANAASWARSQPRKNLWERNARFFIPGKWDSYDAFAADVDDEFNAGEGVWGPHPYAKFYVKPQGPPPPDKGDLSWGIGEEAELINFSPIINPVSTKWTYENSVHGFDPALDLPRRMSIISMTRTSRRLLRLMSADQRRSGYWLVSEASPETWALLHGLKAVYVPHLLAFKSESLQGSPSTVTEEIERMVHKGPRWDLAGGEFSGLLYRDNVGLNEWRWLEASYFFWAGDAPRIWWEYTNGTCTYPLLLHPVKQD